MTILVTGATGQLGRLVLDHLLARGVSPSELRAGARRPERLADLAERGVDVVHLDYDDADSVAAAVGGTGRVLLVSGNEMGRRVPQHRAVVEAAVAAGVERVLYTSVTEAESSALPVAPEHLATEELLRASGLTWTLLRNNWYTENYAPALATARATGTLLTSAGEGRVASATRSEYAEAAAVALTSDDHADAVLELGGDHAWTQAELAAAIAEVVGREVQVHDVDGAGHAAALEQAGLDAGTAGFLVAVDAEIRSGALALADGTLSRLLGRPTTNLVDGLRPLA